MSRINRTFERLQKDGRAALIPFVVAGDPDLTTTEALIGRMAECGADIIELGVPYSDPLADGPTIQAASQRALRSGIDLKAVLGLARRVKDSAAPLVIMTYYNPVLQYGLRAFAADCRVSGISGVIIPDLPPEEGQAWAREARKMKVDTIFLASPTSPPQRVKLADEFSRGFLYYVSLTGVTGVRRELPPGLVSAVRQVKEQCRNPVAVGFGLSTPEQAREVGRMADGVIVGSAIVRLIEAGGTDLPDRVGGFVSSLAEAIRQGSGSSGRSA